VTGGHPVILSGVVGSVAYGLAREGSDVDRLGVFAAPATAVAGLDWTTSRDTTVRQAPDVTLHEARKFLTLALGCNPTVLELLWLPDALYETRTAAGEVLLDLRAALLSERRVRAAYGGYARAQAAKLASRGDSFSSDTRGRTVKHARHLLRLLRQGRELLVTGRLTVAVPDPETYWAFDTMTPAQMIAMYRHEHDLLEGAGSVLPVAPDRARVAAGLDEIRKITQA
jgi:predicted nucleotidyltransferase